MSFTNIKLNSQERGFTIVELLIVVVVIAILAAITIVSYNGITNRANASSAASNAETAQKVAEGFSADCSRYPASIAEFRSGCTAALSGVTGQAPTSTLPAAVTVFRPAVGTGTGTAPTTVSTATIAGTGTAGLNAGNGTNAVTVFITGTASQPTGGVIVTWDYGTGAVQVPARYTYYGAASSTSTFIQIGA
jgi:prepilin-type N-terminal cleavage/methylation domain-containing protein